MGTCVLYNEFRTHVFEDRGGVKLFKVRKRIYIKNKLKFYTFLTIVFLFSILMMLSIFTHKVEGHEKPNTKIVVVSKGDTLWDIASKYINIKFDIRDEIYHIKKINDLQTSNIYPGQELIIPIRE